MAADRRRAGATATTGAVLTFGGGVLRHKGVREANGGEIPSFTPRRPIRSLPARALVRRGAKGRAAYVTGATLGLIGAPALAVGAHDLVQRKPVTKREKTKVRDYVAEGLAGTADATQQRLASARETPPKAKAVPVAVGIGAGAAGSQTAHTVLNRYKAFQTGRRHGARAGITATAGAAAAAAAFPLSRHLMRGNREYEVTPAGVRRRRTVAVRPSSKASRAQRTPRSFTADMSKVYNPDKLHPTTSLGTERKVHWLHGEKGAAICGLDGAFGKGRGPFAEHYGEVTCVGCKRMLRIAKADSSNYLGRRVSPGRQRAAIYAAGSTPLVGPVAAGHAAARFAPPGHRRQAGVKQSAGILGGGIAGAAGGAYGLASAAEHHAGVRRGAERAAEMHGRAVDRVNHLRPVAAVRSKIPNAGGRRAGQLAERALASRAAGPINRQRVAAGVGAYLGSKIGGFAGTTAAMNSNLREQKRYNLKHPVTKAQGPMTQADQHKLARKKRLAATSSTVTGLTGISALGMLAASKHPRYAAQGAKLEHRRNALLAVGAGVGGANSLNFAGVLRREANREDPNKRKGALVAKALFDKAERREPLTRMRADQAAQIVRRHGDAGPLPNTLSRSERMQAYEARYVHAGGHKAEHWQRRADMADKVKVGGLAGATAGGAAYLALRHPKIAARMGSHAGRVKHAADTATIGAATVSGAGELYAGHARRKRSSYSNSKAGVAASALRRMRDYQS